MITFIRKNSHWLNSAETLIKNLNKKKNLQIRIKLQPIESMHKGRETKTDRGEGQSQIHPRLIQGEKDKQAISPSTRKSSSAGFTAPPSPFHSLRAG